MSDATIARAMSVIDSTADERDELRAALDSMTDERDAALFEVARLTAQLADADKSRGDAVIAAVQAGYRIGYKSAMVNVDQFGVDYARKWQPGSEANP